MEYYKIAQPVPGKGMAWTYYELEEEKIKRILTHIPETGETTLYPKPKMKTLFQPERLTQTDAEEFLEIWKSGEAAGS